MAPETADWIWEQVYFYTKPMAPHPDDLLVGELLIDDDDIAMDWPRDFAKSREIEIKSWPEWPNDWPLSVRNFAIWLDLAV